MNKKYQSIFSKINAYGLILKSCKKSLIGSLLVGGALSMSASVSANEHSGYLNSDNLISSFVSEVSNNVYRELSQDEKLMVLEIQNKLNEQLIENGLTQNIHFRTDKHKIDEPVYNYLNNIILSLNNYENLKYELNGYADFRGNADHNMRLSENRVNAVKDVLLNLGVDYTNIMVNYYGDSKSEEQSDNEKYFYDRRVELKIKIK